MIITRNALSLSGVCLSAALLLVGCGKKQKPLYPVTGQVVAGPAKKPAVGAVLFFHPVEKDAGAVGMPMAEVDQDGRFALTTRISKDGAPAGDYLITVIWPPIRKSLFEPEEGDRLKGAFADVQQAKIRFTVLPATSNEVPLIELP